MLISFDSKPYQGQEKWGRVGLFECECGCGQTFFAAVKTRHPRYANPTHRARAYRARAKARAIAYAWWISDAGYDGPSYGEVYEKALRDALGRNGGR